MIIYYYTAITCDAIYTELIKNGIHASLIEPGACIYQSQSEVNHTLSNSLNMPHRLVVSVLYKNGSVRLADVAKDPP